MKTVRIGSGGGYAAAAMDPALDSIKYGDISYICFDSLSENELSLVALEKIKDSSIPGYDLQLEKRMKKLLKPALDHKVKIIGNMGSGNPVAAAEYIAGQVKALGYTGVKVAAVTGDNVREFLLASDYKTVENDRPIRDFGDKMLAAHAYIACDGIVEALEHGADIVVTGRMGDAAMYLGALRYEFGWAADDWDKLALGTMVGHQLECEILLCGGNFTDPPYKYTPQLWRAGYPIAEVGEDGSVIFTKPEGTGGMITVDTCKEQWLYEIVDPFCYKHADVSIDITKAHFEQIGKDRVRLCGPVVGSPYPDTLKVAIGVQDGYYTQATIWVGGPGALGRAKFARDMLNARFAHLGFRPDVYKLFLLGIEGLYGDAPGVPKDLDPWEVGIRFAARGQDRAELEEMVHEATGRMTGLGPAGITCESFSLQLRDVVKYYHTFIPRDVIEMKVTYVEV